MTVLIIESVIACVIFTVIMVGWVLINKTAFLNEYAPAVRERFISKHPEHKALENPKMTPMLFISKLAMSLLFIAILTIMVRIAGADGFIQSAVYAYIIWFIVNWYDVFALDMGIFAKWKKVRLDGTEDMDKEYSSNAKKHIADGFFGTFFGIAIAVICGWLNTII